MVMFYCQPCSFYWRVERKTSKYGEGLKDELVCGGMMIEERKASFLGGVIFGDGEPGRSLF